ncbi:MAG TPA: hypothetical protein VHG29_00615 [Novosphingobium sp.]|nr:hypothetical protein [Novosphingobium sp.]
MADRHPEPDSPELRARWSGFAGSADNAVEAPRIIGALDEVFGECDR